MLSLNTEYITVAQRLLQAETIRDIYTAPFPQEVSPLERPHTLFNYHREKGPEALDIYLLEGRGLPIDEDKKLKAFREATTIITSHNEAIAKKINRVDQSSDWQALVTAFMSARRRHGVSLHVDLAAAELKDIVYLATSADGTWVVPHVATLKSIENSSISRILDLRLDNPTAREQFLTAIRGASALIEHLQGLMVLAPAGKAHALSALTFHMQPKRLSPKRICYRHLTHFSASGS